MIRTILLLLVTTSVYSQDSLFLNSEFGTSFEDNPCSIGTQISVPKGNITAIKFYKTDASAAAYTINVWSGSNRIFTQEYRSTTTKWQRIAVNIPIEAGVYTISVYNPVGRYSFRKTVFPRTRGSITGQEGKFGYTKDLPPPSGGTSYYVDAVLSPVPAVPLSVKVTPENTQVPFTSNGIVLTGKITGAYKSFEWEILEQVGAMTFSNATTLTPVVNCKDSSGCSIRVMLTATDANGNQQAELADVVVLPHPDQWIFVGTRGGRILWLKRVVILD